MLRSSLNKHLDTEQFFCDFFLYQLGELMRFAFFMHFHRHPLNMHAQLSSGMGGLNTSLLCVRAVYAAARLCGFTRLIKCSVETVDEQACLTLRCSHIR